jgi:hypothetical protein
MPAPRRRLPSRAAPSSAIVPIATAAASAPVVAIGRRFAGPIARAAAWPAIRHAPRRWAPCPHTARRPPGPPIGQAAGPQPARPGDPRRPPPLPLVQTDSILSPERRSGRCCGPFLTGGRNVGRESPVRPVSAGHARPPRRLDCLSGHGAPRRPASTQPCSMSCILQRFACFTALCYGRGPARGHGGPRGTHGALGSRLWRVQCACDNSGCSSPTADGYGAERAQQRGFAPHYRTIGLSPTVARARAPVAARTAARASWAPDSGP